VGSLRIDKVVIECCQGTGCEDIIWIHHTVTCPI